MSKILEVVHKIRKYKKTIVAAVLFCFVYFWFFTLPKPLFEKNYSQAVFSKDGELIGATIAKDEQWRFPVSDSIPIKFKKSIIYFEDEYFNYHLGINPISLIRAIKNNLKSGAITSGGSTLTMQTIRLSKENPKRTYWEKCKEMVQAFRLECSYSKNSILTLYSSHAPFGGNTVGLDAAAWRYYGKLPHQLSWGECATLAVLPNAPALIYPGKNQEALKKKRNRLLRKLLDNKEISEEDYLLALEEPLPQKPYPLPNHAYHFVQLSYKKYPNSRIHSTIDLSLQQKVNHVVKRHHQKLRQREIQNIAVIISEVETGNVISYVGNTSDIEKKHQNDVDINQAYRSSGSILKPILYTSMIDNGELLPNMLLSDVPSDISENFSKKYKGVVPAHQALAESLNIPAINMLRMHGVNVFLEELQNLGFKSLNENGSHYGLSLIVGGAEISPWNLNNAYRNLAYTLINSENKKYYEELCISTTEKPKETETPKYSKHSINNTFVALQNVVRPYNEAGWRLYGNKNIAWKTGTSHGYKDAWSVGITSKYVITVWVGNADGEGRPGIIGVEAAAPILFDIFNYLPQSESFVPTSSNLKRVATCKQSGFLKSKYCTQVENVKVPNRDIKVDKCSYHKEVLLDSTQQYRVNLSCYPLKNTVRKVFFTLPVIEEKYYKEQNPWYKSLPSYMTDCESTSEKKMDFIYPRNFTQIFLPKNAEGKVQPMIVRVSHKEKDATLTWMLDGKYIQQTQEEHYLSLQTDYGKHSLVVVDNIGNSIKKDFSVFSKN